MALDMAADASSVAALADAETAVFDYENARGWFRSVAATFAAPLAVETWVLDPSLRQVLLVRHR
jgi:hypothetical protein